MAVFVSTQASWVDIVRDQLLRELNYYYDGVIITSLIEVPNDGEASYYLFHVLFAQANCALNGQICEFLVDFCK